MQIRRAVGESTPLSTDFVDRQLHGDALSRRCLRDVNGIIISYRRYTVAEHRAMRRSSAASTATRQRNFIAIKKNCSGTFKDVVTPKVVTTPDNWITASRMKLMTPNRPSMRLECYQAVKVITRPC